MQYVLQNLQDRTFELDIYYEADKRCGVCLILFLQNKEKYIFFR